MFLLLLFIGYNVSIIKYSPLKVTKANFATSVCTSRYLVLPSM